jgi:LDH2 family malate/lactate/ureidoglycolate dehydrogenase
MEKERMQNGIPIVQDVQHDLSGLAEKMNLSFELKD